MEYPFKDLLPRDEVLEREGYYKDWTHLDPKVFYSLTQISEYIKTKGFGVDVRLLISQLAEHFSLKTSQINEIERFFKDVMQELGEDKDFYSLPEIAGARRGYSTLAESLGNLSVNMINKNLGKLDQSFMTDEFLQQIAGNTPINAVPADGSITTPKYVNRSITPKKLNGNTIIQPFDIEGYNISATKERVWIKKEPISTQGFVSIEFKSNAPSTGKIVIAKKHDKQMTIQYVKEIQSTSGMNYVYTDYIASGEGNEYVGMINGGLTYGNAGEVIGNFLMSLEYSNVQVGRTVYFEDHSSSTIKLGFNVVVSDKVLSKSISDIQDDLGDNAITSRQLHDSMVIDDAPIETFNNSATTNMLWFKKDPLPSSGKVSVEYKSSDGSYGKIVIAEISSDRKTIIRHVEEVQPKIGMNYVDIDYISTGNGNEYVGMLNGGLMYTSSVDVVGHISIAIEDINVGDVVYVSHSPESHVRLGFTVILSETVISNTLKQLKGNSHQPLKTPKDIFATYLIEGGQGVVIGDSNTAGVGTTGYSTTGPEVGNSGVGSSPMSHNWANRLIDTVSTINPNTNLRNWGISGWSTNTFVSRGLSNYIKPTDNIAIIMLGTNDRVGQGDSKVTQFENDLNTIVSYCNSINVPIILLSPIPASVNNDNNLDTYAFDTFDVNNVVKRVANKIGMTHIDNYDWFLQYEENGNDISDLYSDELHMSDYGSYEYLFRNVINGLGVSYRRAEINR